MDEIRKLCSVVIEVKVRLDHYQKIKLGILNVTDMEGVKVNKRKYDSNGKNLAHKITNTKTSPRKIIESRKRNGKN